MNFFDNTTLNNHRDQALRNRYGYNYGYLKYKYPHADELSDTEIERLINLIYQNGNTLEEAEPYLDEYVQQIRPQWFQENSGNSLNSTMNMTNRTNTEMSRLQQRLQAQAENQKRLDAYNNRGFYLTGDQWADVGKATLDGIVSGTESFLDHLTHGGYGFANRQFFDGGIEERRNRLQQEADLAGLGMANDFFQTGLNNLGDLGKYSIGLASTPQKIKNWGNRFLKDIPTLQKLGRQYLNKYWK